MMKQNLKNASKTYPNLNEEINSISPIDAKIISNLVETLQLIFPNHFDFLDRYKEIPDFDFFSELSSFLGNFQNYLKFNNNFIVKGRSFKISYILTIEKTKTIDLGFYVYNIVINKSEQFIKHAPTNLIFSFQNESERDKIYDKILMQMDYLEKIKMLSNV